MEPPEIHSENTWTSEGMSRNCKLAGVLATAHVLREVLMLKYAIFVIGNSTTCATYCNYRIAKILYTLETCIWFRYCNYSEKRRLIIIIIIIIINLCSLAHTSLLCMRTFPSSTYHIVSPSTDSADQSVFWNLSNEILLHRKVYI
jgi:hypothetical protein